jgi:hypothetical protein
VDTVQDLKKLVEYAEANRCGQGEVRETGKSEKQAESSSIGEVVLLI